MTDSKKNLGENDARFIDTFSNVAPKVVDSISHKLHPMIEQYANCSRMALARRF